MIVCVFSDDRDDLRFILNGMNYAWRDEYFVLLDGFQDEWRLGVLAWIYELDVVELDDHEAAFILEEFGSIPDLDYLLECMNVKL